MFIYRGLGRAFATLPTSRGTLRLPKNASNQRFCHSHHQSISIQSSSPPLHPLFRYWLRISQSTATVSCILYYLHLLNRVALGTRFHQSAPICLSPSFGDVRFYRYSRRRNHHDYHHYFHCLFIISFIDIFIVNIRVSPRRQSSFPLNVSYIVRRNRRLP